MPPEDNEGYYSIQRTLGRLEAGILALHEKLDATTNTTVKAEGRLVKLEKHQWYATGAIALIVLFLSFFDIKFGVIK